MSVTEKKNNIKHPSCRTEVYSPVPGSSTANDNTGQVMAQCLCDLWLAIRLNGEETSPLPLHHHKRFG